MPSNYTEHYQLNQWERSDKVLMDDFNADNAKLDAALKAEADARVSEVATLTAALGQKGNCRIQSFSVYDDGDYNTPVSFSFPKRPVLFLIFASAYLAVCPGHTGENFVICNIASGAYLSSFSYTWEGNTVTARYIDSGKARTYTVVAFYAED